MSERKCYNTKEALERILEGGHESELSDLDENDGNETEAFATLSPRITEESDNESTSGEEANASVRNEENDNLIDSFEENQDDESIGIEEDEIDVLKF